MGYAKNNRDSRPRNSSFKFGQPGFRVASKSERRVGGYQEHVRTRRSDRQEQRRRKTDAQRNKQEAETVANRTPATPETVRIGRGGFRARAVRDTASIRLM